MMTDPIADMLTRIRNAGMAKLTKTSIPFSRIKGEIAEILKREGFISDFTVAQEKKPQIVVEMKYGNNRRSAIAGLQRASRPGRRIYVGHEEIPRVQNGLGIAVLSTSKGLMTDREARENRIGGELLCRVW